MNLGNYCRDYRMSCQSTLSDLCRNHKDKDRLIKSLSAFEHGRSTNYKHLQYYTLLAYERGDVVGFALGLMEVLNNG